MNATNRPIDTPDTPRSDASRQIALDAAALDALDASLFADRAASALKAGRLDDTARHVADASKHAFAAMNTLTGRLHAASPIPQRMKLRNAPDARAGFNLAALDTMDTPDTRALLDLLDQAQAVAERIDAARGRAVSADMPLAPGESRGTDLAEGVSMLALRVRGEVFRGCRERIGVTIMQSEQWYRVDFTTKQILEGKVSVVMDALMHHFIANGAPPHTTLWDDGKHGASSLFFSPTAARLMTDLIENFNGVAVERPNVKGMSFLFGNEGDRMNEIQKDANNDADTNA